MKTSKGSIFKRLLKEVRNIFSFLRIWWYLYEKQEKCTREAVTAYLPSWLPSSLEDSSPRTTDAYKDPDTGDEHFYNNAVRFMVLEDLRYKSFVKMRGSSCQRQARGRRTGSRRTFRRCERRRSGLPAHMTTAFWTNLCGGSQSYSL